MSQLNEMIKDKILFQYDELAEKDPEYAALLKIITEYHDAETSIKALQTRQRGVFSDMGRSQFNYLIKNQCDHQKTLVENAKRVVAESVNKHVALQRVELTPTDKDNITAQIVAEFMDVNSVCPTLSHL